MRYVILHNVRSAHNVGSIFRTADGAGVAKLYLTGYTPTPIDRFGREVAEIKKTSLGAAALLPWEYAGDTLALVLHLKAAGVTIVAVEQHERSIDYRVFTPIGDTAYIFGNEIEGVPEEICRESDAVIAIPMHGMKESLNVSVAAGVILFAATR